VLIGQSLGSCFGFSGSVFRVQLGFSLQFTYCNANKKLLTACQLKPLQRLSMHVGLITTLVHVCVTDVTAK